MAWKRGDKGWSWFSQHYAFTPDRIVEIRAIDRHEERYLRLRPECKVIIRCGSFGMFLASEDLIVLLCRWHSAKKEWHKELKRRRAEVRQRIIFDEFY